MPVTTMVFKEMISATLFDAGNFFHPDKVGDMVPQGMEVDPGKRCKGRDLYPGVQKDGRKNQTVFSRDREYFFLKVAGNP